MASKTSLLPLVRSFDWKAVAESLDQRRALIAHRMSGAGTVLLQQQVRRRRPAIVLRIDVRAAIEQGFGGLEMAPADRAEQRRFATPR